MDKPTDPEVQKQSDDIVEKMWNSKFYSSFTKVVTCLVYYTSFAFIYSSISWQEVWEDVRERRLAGLKRRKVLREEYGRKDVF